MLFVGVKHTITGFPGGIEESVADRKGTGSLAGNLRKRSYDAPA